MKEDKEQTKEMTEIDSFLTDFDTMLEENYLNYYDDYEQTTMNIGMYT